MGPIRKGYGANFFMILGSDGGRPGKGEGDWVSREVELGPPIVRGARDR